MKIGIVKWFDEAKGYGFIAAEGIESDIFVHFSEIQQEGYKTLAEGEQVEFEYLEEEGRGRAVNVIRQADFENKEANKDETSEE